MMINKRYLYYLSHPYTTFGDPERNQIMAKNIEEVLKGVYGISVINPILLPLGESNDEAMKKCRSLYEACDAIILCPGWEKSTGCQEEYKWALAENKIILILSEEYVLKRTDKVG